MIKELQQYGELVGPIKLRFNEKYNKESEFTLEWSIRIRTGTYGMTGHTITERGNSDKEILSRLLRRVKEIDEEDGIFIEDDDRKPDFQSIPRGNRWWG